MPIEFGAGRVPCVGRRTWHLTCSGYALKFKMWFGVILMRSCAVFIIVITGLVVSEHIAAQAPSFYQEWRTEQTRRLARLLPSNHHRHVNPSGVSGLAIAEVLGVSRAFVSNALNGPKSGFNHAHILKLAQHLNVRPGYLYVDNFFDRFATLDQLEDAICDERLLVRELLTRIFMERTAALSASGRDGEVSFERRRRATIKLRLSHLIPGTRGSTVGMTELARITGRSRPRASRMINGPNHLRYEDAEALGAHFGRTPEWFLAADLLDEFSSAEDLERAVLTEKPEVKALLTKLWNARCRQDLAPIAKPLRKAL